MSSVIVSGARTPMGKLLGNLKDFPATELGGVAIKAALERAGVAPDQVQYVIMGQVLQAGAGQIPARQAAVNAGIPMSTPALTINKVCLSGLDAIALADQLIRAGEFDIVVAGGMESMTNAPHLLMGQRQGYKYGDVVDQGPHGARRPDRRVRRVLDGRVDRAAQRPRTASPASSRTRSAPRSHQKAAAAQKNGVFAEEITPVEIPQRKGEPLLVLEDEGIRPETTAESLGKLRAAFAQGRHDHRRYLVADLRRRRRGRRDEQGEGRGAGPDLARRDRRARQRRRPGQLAARPAGQRDRARAGARPA